MYALWIKKIHADYANYNHYVGLRIRPMLKDDNARKYALDPQKSFIVQAPAGSGKTELLVQRFLRLLSTVSKPEEILCITFTRKAALQMRTRVIKALRDSKDLTLTPKSLHEKNTFELARVAIAQSSNMGWGIIENPSRLKIQTIDSFCGFLTRNMPFLSGLGGQMEIDENPHALYKQAARRLIGMVDDKDKHGDAVRKVLTHMDNNPQRLETLIISMLGRRDQWMEYTLKEDKTHRDMLEKGLQESITGHLTRLLKSLPPGMEPALSEVAPFAAGNVADTSRIALLKDICDLPCPTPKDLPRWQAIADLLLTNGGQLRSPGGINKKIGFPSDKKEPYMSMKKTMQSLVENLAPRQDVIDLLEKTRILPEPGYRDDQWDILNALLHILKLAASHLYAIFKENVTVDFIELARGALDALGLDEAPTDLLLRLDYLIKHILVDEFQDTSYTQVRLLERLTSGWMPGDGRTLFMVGDPMQSIYRFRKAQVGLFIHAKDYGINNITPKPLFLSSNFRSQKGIVEWINSSFKDIFPSHDDAAAGAVSYTPMEATVDSDTREPVVIHPYISRDDSRESEDVVETVKTCMDRYNDETIAILVRAKTHLPLILKRLRETGVRYRAEEIEELGGKTVVQELFALTRALSHLGDRVAWLAILRARWCGLYLEDLYQLCHDSGGKTVFDLLHDKTRIGNLSKDAKGRLERTLPVIDKTLENLSREHLREQVKRCWIALGGPACMTDEELCDAEVFFSLLDSIDAGGMITSVDALYNILSDLYASPDPYASESVEVMTIHKAKGLEFDTVILPGLGKEPRRDEDPLVRWVEHPDCKVLLAPIEKKGAKNDDPIYKYIKRLENDMSAHEDRRLIYVAATRAKKQLHLFGHVSQGKDSKISPSKASLLNYLWEKVDDVFMNNTTGSLKNDTTEEIPQASRVITRIPAEWRMPEIPPGIGISTIEKIVPSETSKDQTYIPWPEDTKRYIGTVVHGILEEIATHGIHRWDDSHLEENRLVICQRLKLLWVSKGDLNKATDETLKIVRNALCDSRGQWILSPHRDARCEYKISGLVDGGVVHACIDRTFIDDSDTRWIIDYKTSCPRGTSLNNFLDEEQERYRNQLDIYGCLMKNTDTDRDIMLGLYFPCLPAWRQWNFICK